MTPLLERSARRAERWSVVAIVVLLGLPLVGLLGSVAGQVVPDGRLLGRLAVELDTGRLTRDDDPVTRLGTRVDGYGDCLVLGAGVGGDRWDLIGSAVRSPSLGPCSSLTPRVREYTRSGEIEPLRDYYRYWHGYTVLTRPSIAVVGVPATRVLAGVLLLAGLAALVATLRRGHGRLAAVAFLAPLVLVTDWWDLPWSLLTAITVAAVLGTAAAVHQVVTRSVALPVLALTGAVAGAALVYLDLLTQHATASVAVGAVAAAAALRHGRTGAGTARVTAAVLGGWLVGWTWMWASKWMLAALVMGPGTVADDITGQIEKRTSGANDEVRPGLGRGVLDVLGVWFDRPLAVPVTALVLVAAVVAFSRRGADRRALVVALPALLPLGWFTVLNSHTQIHDWLVYRAVAVALGAIALAAVVAVRPSPAVENDVLGVVGIDANGKDGARDDAPA